MKKAFTLAEVLITLGIIGVVSAITLPAMFTNFKKRETVAKVKVAYSIFSQAVKLSIEDNDEVGGWDFSNEANVAEQYIIPYMTGVTRYSQSLDKIPMRTLSSQGNAEKNRYLDWSWHVSARPVYMMQNGMFFTFANSYDGYPTIVVDINGMGKPNIMGIDGFTFWIDSETSSVVPAGAKFSRDVILGKSGNDVRACKRDSSWQYYRGGYCAALMQKDGWAITSDYPWGNGNLTK